MALQPEPDPHLVARQPGHGMKPQHSHHVPWFNPREMDDATVLHLNTGRSALLEQLGAAIDERLQHPGTASHWLCTGARGAGKSFFLRLVQTSFQNRWPGQVRLVLLPEEHRNIYAPHEFLAEVERMLRVHQGDIGQPPAWRVAQPDLAWQQALTSLLQAFDEPLLVIGVENFDDLLVQAFEDDTAAAHLRHLLANQPRLMLVATAVQGSFDEDYSERLFRQFEHHPIPPWSATEHRDYLSRRAERSGKKPSPRQLARIEAYSYYTGGNARAAAVLAGVILEENDPLQTAGDLDAAIEKMTDYYRALIDRIPPKTRKLFDALIRGGEPASQTQIAERTGAQQNEISRAFAWLLDNGYINESRLPGSKSKQYRVCDRLLVQFYRMRSINPGQKSKLALMADLLADTLDFNEKWKFARQYANEGHTAEAETLAELALKERMIALESLLPNLTNTEHLYEIGDILQDWENLLIPGDEPSTINNILNHYKTDDQLGKTIIIALTLITAISEDNAVWKQLGGSIEHLDILCPVQKLYTIILILFNNKSDKFINQILNLVSKNLGVITKKTHEIQHTIFNLGIHAIIGGIFPRTISLQNMAEQVESNPTTQYSTQQGIEWAIQATSGWQSKNIDVFTKNSLNITTSLIKRLAHTEEHFQEALKFSKELLLQMHDSSPHLMAKIYALIGEIEIEIENFEDAYQHLSIARDRHIECGDQRDACFILEDMAWSQSCLGKKFEALELHKKAWAEQSSEFPEFCSNWNLGQIARHTATFQGADAAWEVIDNEIEKSDDDDHFAIKELGDAIADFCQEEGEISGFSIGIDLLKGLAARPQFSTEKNLRHLWIEMIEVGVPLTVLRDLLNEWPLLFNLQAHPNLETLRNLLHEWLNDLATPATQRQTRRLSLDPDLLTTVTQLEKSLSRRTKKHWGLPLEPVQITESVH